MLEQDENGLEPGFDLSGADDGAAAAEEEEEEPGLDALDDEARAIAERVIAREKEAQLAGFREIGFDVNREGRPLIADPTKVAAFAGAVPPRQQPVAAAAPPPPAAAPAEDADEEIDLLSATPQDLVKFVDRRVAKQTRTLAEENAYLRGLMQQRAASESVQSIRRVVEERLPALAPLLDHPDFAAQFEQQTAGADPAFLANPQAVSGLAAAIMAGLDKERMPMPRDTQGRFTGQQPPPPPTDAQARYQTARQGLASLPPARGAGVQRGGGQPDPRVEEGVGYLRDIARYLPPSVTHGPEASAAEWDAAQYHDIDQWKAAMDRAKAATANGARRR